MDRAGQLAVICMILAMACGDSDTIGFPGPATEEYFPYSPGDTLIFERSGEGEKRLVAYTVSGTHSIVATREVTHAGGFPVVEVIFSGQDTLFWFGVPEPQPAYSDTQYVRVSPMSVEGFADTASVIPAWTIPLPLQMGDIWFFSSDSLVEGKVRLLGDIVESPSGVFDQTMKLRFTNLADTSVVDYTETWYAPGIGAVMSEGFESKPGAWQVTTDELVYYTVL